MELEGRRWSVLMVTRSADNWRGAVAGVCGRGTYREEANAMSDATIAIKEKILGLRAKQRKFACREAECAVQARHWIWLQSQLEDDILILEHELARETIAGALGL